MKFSRKVLPLKVTSTPYFLIPYFQPFQNGGRSNFWGGHKTCTSQRETMKFFYTDRSSKDEQLLIRQFLLKTESTNMAAAWMLKFIFGFVETTHEPLYLEDELWYSKRSWTYL
jgi:hypothetical protein